MVLRLSHPTRVRGLKPSTVASFVNIAGFAPHTGAWIETEHQELTLMTTQFAPHTGAWIETQTSKNACKILASHPTRVRGLKRSSFATLTMALASHPTRVRGLKLNYVSFYEFADIRTPHGCVD